MSTASFRLYPLSVEVALEPAFVADAHLGGLARFLRMLGLDTLHDNGFSDEAIRRHRARLLRGFAWRTERGFSLTPFGSRAVLRGFAAGRHNTPAMQTIVRLDEYRKQRKRGRAVTQAPDAPRYFCLSCDTDHFKLYASGSVHCAACGSLIRNVHALSTPDR